MFFKRKAVSEVTFYDWVSRLTAALDESFVEVDKSNRENSFENVIRVFRTKTKGTLALISGIDVRVDTKGVYTTNDFTKDRIYLVSFCNGKVVELPLDESLKDVGCREYIVDLLRSTYFHHLAKLEDQEARLIREQRDVMKKKARIADLLVPLPRQEQPKQQLEQDHEE